MMKVDKWFALVLVLLLTACGGEGESQTSVPDGGDTAVPPTMISVTAPINGTAGFQDGLAVADRFVAALTAVPAPPTGQAYQGWLVGDEGAVLSLGMLPVSADGRISLTWDSPSGENLLSRYARFQITLEPEAGSANPTGNVLAAGGLQGEALTKARRLFVKNEAEPATPLNTPFAIGLLAETEIAAQHVQNAINAAAIGAQDEMRAHLEHVVNILEGMEGARYGDHDGHGTAENPGDGFGVLGYAGQVAQMLIGQEQTAESFAAIQSQITAVQDKCLEILPMADTAAAATQLNEAETLMTHLQDDLVAALYQAAQESVQFEVTAVE